MSILSSFSKYRNITFLLVFFLSSYPGVCLATLSWSTKVPMPTARYDMAVGMVGNVIYVMGGDPGSLVPISTVEAYDPGLPEIWTVKTPMPYAMHRLAAAVIGIKIYTCGGWYGMGAKPYTLEYDPGLDTWTQKADMPAARLFHAAASYGGKMYAFGGRYTYNTVFEYDPVGDSWATKTPMPTARYGHAAVTVGSKIYVIGGQDGTSIFATVEEYDPIADSWTTKTPMPTPRTYLTACVVRDTIYAIGGSDNTKAYLNTVEKYDPATDKWASDTPMPTARAAPVSAVINNIIYVIGGDNGDGIDVNEAAEPIATNIELSSFYATGKGAHIRLFWKTESESDIASWIIERGTNHSYSVIARLEANGSTPGEHSYQYTDKNVETSKKYYYRLGAQRINSSTKWYGPVSAIIPTTRPFLNISPNPFATKTVIEFKSSGVREFNSKLPNSPTPQLRIYDVSGRLVKSFSLFSPHSSLISSVTWDGKNYLGKKIAPGIYFVQLKADGISQTEKLVLLK